MTIALLNGYLIVLVILFIIILIIFGIAFARTRHTDKRIPSSTAPTDISHRNEHTRVDQHDTDVS